MDSLPLNTNAADLPGSARALRQRQLLDLLISDAGNDVEVVSRELGLRGEMRERLRRAHGRMACAQRVLESMRTDSAAAGIDGSAADEGRGGIAGKRVAGGLSGRGGRVAVVAFATAFGGRLSISTTPRGGESRLGRC
jgi:hypothetical protein